MQAFPRSGPASHYTSWRTKEKEQLSKQIPTQREFRRCAQSSVLAKSTCSPCRNGNFCLWNGNLSFHRNRMPKHVLHTAESLTASACCLASRSRDSLQVLGVTPLGFGLPPPTSGEPLHSEVLAWLTVGLCSFDCPPQISYNTD